MRNFCLNGRPLIVILILFFFSFMFAAGCGKKQEEIKSVKIKPENPSVRVGETLRFSAVPLSGGWSRIQGVTVQWNVDGDAGIIDQDGLFTAEKPGKAMVTASAGPIVASTEVQVMPLEVKRIVVNAESSKILAGSTVNLKVKAYSDNETPAGFNTITVSSTNPGVRLPDEPVKLDSRGEADCTVAVSSEPGVNQIIFTSGEISGEIEIQGTEISRLEISPSDEVFEAMSKVRFQAVGFDKFENHRPVKVKWIAGTKNLTVEEDGTVIMEAPGKAKLAARLGDITTVHSFAVVPGKLARMEIQPTRIQLTVGERQRLDVAGFNQFGFPVQMPVEWDVPGEMVRIYRDGTIFAEKAGNCTITAKAGGLTAEVQIDISHGTLADIVIDIQEEEVKAGTTLALKAEGMDAFGNRFELEPEWVLTRPLGEIDKEKKEFKAMYAGTGELQARMPEFLKGHKLTVTPAEFDHIKIEPASVSLMAGEHVQFKATGFDKFGNEVEVMPVFTTSQKENSIGPAGNFTAVKAGNTIVTASVDEINATAEVAVTPAPMTKVTMSPESPVKLSAGSVQAFRCTGYDEFGNVVKASVSWELSEPIGEIDDFGVFQSRKAGKGQIVATIKDLDSGNTMESVVEIEVVPGDPVRLEIAPADFKMSAGEEQRFTATVYDLFDNPFEVQAQWSVEEFPVGEIDSDGVLRAVKAGTGVVRAVYGDFSVQTRVQVVPAKVAVIKVMPESISVAAGEKVELEAVSEDNFGNVIDLDVEWNLTDKRLGEMQPEGIFMPQSAGKGYLMAIADNLVKMIPVR